jgi:hypothetical protein
MMSTSALIITPAFFYRPARQWWIQVDAESNTNWKRDSHTDFRVGFQVGKMITRRLALRSNLRSRWAEEEWAIGP